MISNTQYLIKHANDLFKKDKYEAALDAYNNICTNRPEMAWIIEPNIKITKQRIGGNHTEEQTPTSNKNRALEKISYKTTSAYKWASKECKQHTKACGIKTSNNLVTVVMPARNSAPFISASIKSLMEQSHNNLEIIVIDDYSDDDTGKIVKELSKIDNRVRYVRVNANLGTYFARSYGVSLAKGDYITFQDADDFSHESRIEIHLHEAISSNTKIITSNYVRFDIISGEIINFHGNMQHYGFITTFAHRSIFSEIGSFDLTSRGGDAEFSARISRNIPKEITRHLSFPTYLASDMPGSLSYGEIDRTTQNRHDALSYPRAKYAKNFLSINQTFNKSELATLFKFPMLRSPYNLPTHLGKASINKYTIIGCVCTIPERMEIFKQAFESIESQVDVLYVYPDKYIEHEIPNYIINSPKVIVLSTKENPDLRDGAKFLPMQQGLLDKNLDQTIVFTFDDDILYPPDYVHSLYQRLSNIDFNGVVGVHGAILNENFQNFRTDRIVYNFKHELNQEILVDVLGTGTVAFRADVLRKRFLKEDINPGMIDISLAVVCRRNLIPLHCISRPNGWLRDLTIDKDLPSLWEELVQNSSPHTSALKQIHSNMWGSAAIQEQFIKRKMVLNDLKKHHSFEFYLIKNTHLLSILQITLNRESIYKIAIEIKNNKISSGRVVLRNAITGSVIYTKEPSNDHITFLCNGTLNKHLSIDLAQLETKNPEINGQIKIEELFDAVPPKEIQCGDKTITACLATYPPRQDCLQDVVNSTFNQVDNLCLYFNRYSHLPQPIADLLNDTEKSKSLDFILDFSGKPKASGKFRWIDREGYIFTLDDDILYPENYFSHLIAWIEKFKRNAFIGVHGVIFATEVTSFHKDTKSSIIEKFNFSEGLTEEKMVHLIGTGTLAFHASMISKHKEELYQLMNFRDGYENANDECLAVFAKQKNIPMYIVPRKNDWLKSNKKMKYGIFEEHFNDATLSDSVVNLLATANPWPNIS
jgi:glycosyltransferase involved in cell wall biosynthesis